jgi:hypothetical protein
LTSFKIDNWERAMPGKIVFIGVMVLASLLLASAGLAEDARLPHKGEWPIQNGRNYQPTQHDLKALDFEDVTPDQARELDRLYDQLLSGGEKVRNRRPARAH